MVIREFTSHDVVELINCALRGDFADLHDLENFNPNAFEEYWTDVLASQDGQIVGAFAESTANDGEKEETLIAVMGLLYEEDQYDPETVYLVEQFWATCASHRTSKAGLKILDYVMDLSDTYGWPIHLTLGAQTPSHMLWLLAKQGFVVTDLTLERPVSHGEEETKKT